MLISIWFKGKFDRFKVEIKKEVFHWKEDILSAKKFEKLGNKIYASYALYHC